MKNYKDLYNKYKIKYLNFKNSIGGDFIYNDGNIESSKYFLITELHLTVSGNHNLELIKTKVSNFIEKYKSLNSGEVPFESQYNIKGCPIPNKLQIYKNINRITNININGVYNLKNDKIIFKMCSENLDIYIKTKQTYLFISYYDEIDKISNINLQTLNYLGYFSLPFYKTKKEDEDKMFKEDENKIFYVFLLFEKNGIIEIFRPNGKYICHNTFCEYNNFFEYQLDYLKYFSTNSSVYTYKFRNIILFSHYSLEDMKQLFSRVDLSDEHKEKLNIIPHLIDGVIHNYKFVSNSDFIKNRFEILKQNMIDKKYNKKKYITRPASSYNNQFIDTIYPDFNRLLPECKSHSALGNIKFFFRDLDECSRLINSKNHCLIEPPKQPPQQPPKPLGPPKPLITKQILNKNIDDLKQSLIDNNLTNINHDDDIETSDNLWFQVLKQTSLMKKKEIDKFFSERENILTDPANKDLYKKLFKVDNINELFKLYSSSGDDCNSMEKPLLYSNKDYTSDVEEDITKIQPFLPDLIEKTIEYKQNNTDELKSNILARRMGVIAPLEHHRNLENNEYVNQTYKSAVNLMTQTIPDSRKFLYFPFWTKVDRDSSKLQWTILYNKIFIQCNFKDMIFPFIIISDNEKYPKSRYIIMEPEKLIFLGYFQMYFRTKNNSKILYTYYIFYHLEKSRLEIISQYGNEIRINQSLADKFTITYIEIFMIYYENKEKHFYCHPRRSGHYFFSKFTLEEIKLEIHKKFSDDKIASLTPVEKDYIKIFVIPFFNQLEEYEMIMTETGNINFIKKRI